MTAWASFFKIQDAFRMDLTDPRQNLILEWLNGPLQLTIEALEPVSQDASFRRYFRIVTADGPRIVMDAPPPNETVAPFIEQAERFRRCGLITPRIDAADEAQGLLLLEDFGSTAYLDVLNETTAEALYGAARADLCRLARAPAEQQQGLPHYDAPLLRRELSLFSHWCLETHLGLALDEDTRALLNQTFECLVDNALEQPQILVHRDFHSRNLMRRNGPQPGVLDFQDALMGPLTYDLVSLLRDCYIEWNPEQVARWALSQRQQFAKILSLPLAEDTFLRWFDLMGLQRHLKAIGIFTRLLHRDRRPGYIKDIPRTLRYGLEVSHRHPDLAPFAQFLEQRVLPAFEESTPA